MILFLKERKHFGTSRNEMLPVKSEQKKKSISFNLSKAGAELWPK